LLPASAKRTVFLGVRRLVYPEPQRTAAFTAERGVTTVAVARIVVCLSLAAIFLAALYLPPSARTDQPSYDTVGAIEGEDVSVQGPLNIEVVRGRTITILRSGSDIHVNSGQARIDLVEGGQIAVCGPAHLSVLKSVNLLTLALDTGIIHAHIEGPQPTLTVYTAQIQAKPLSIGDAPQDTLVGFDQTGAMCIRADSGAVRVEQQLTAQSIVVPQNGEVLIANGDLESLRSGVTHCSCELQLANPPRPVPAQSEVSRLPTPEEMQQANTEAAKAPAAPAQSEVSRLPTPKEIQKANTEAAKAPAAPAQSEISRLPTRKEMQQANTEAAKAPAAPPKPAAAKEGPVYQVFMPPLSYDASAKVQSDNFDPRLIVLVRRVRVRPTLIFQGSVKDAPAVAKKTSPVAPAKMPETPAPQSQQAQPSIFARIRAFFRSLFS